MPQLEGYGGGGEPQLPQKQQRTGVEYVHPQIAPQRQFQPLGNGQMTQIAHGHGGQHLPVPHQHLPQRRLVLRPENAGQHGAEGRPVQIRGHIQRIQPLHRQIDHLRAAVHQRLRQLLRLLEGAGQQRLRRLLRGIRQRLRLGDPALWHGAENLLQRRQSLPPQGIDRPGGEHQPILQCHPHLPAAEGGAAGLFQTGLQLLRRQRPVSGGLRHGACHLRPLIPGPHRQAHRLSGPADAVHVHRHRPAILLFVQCPGLGKQLLGLWEVLRPGAEHLRPLPTQIVSVGEATAAEGQLQLPLLLTSGAALFIQQPPVNGGDDRHVLRPLHAPFQLQARHPHVLQLL